ncbi:MAG: dihydroorotase [Halobacteriales archaeon]|nr:dihydroorotase [Halobacteriales archaeon]
MLVIGDATLADGRRRDVRVDRESGTIDAVGRQLSGSDRLDARGRLLLPGVIDAHVHFREPGFAHKETWTTGSRSAAAGGVTTVVDQPNTDPPTVTGAAFDEKAELADASLVDWGINGGVTPDWTPEALLDRPLFALGEVFLADSTGEHGHRGRPVRDGRRARGGRGGVPVTVHAEDATRFDETAARPGRTPTPGAPTGRPRPSWPPSSAPGRSPPTTTSRIHIAHTSTPEGVDAATAAGLTCEVTPHHLFLSRDDLDELGTFGRMNPPLRSEARREALFERVADGTVDMIATDHAPHTREEKAAGVWDAPSGVPGVETALPLLLEAARRGELSYERVRDLTAANPAAVFDLPRKGRIEAGRDADLVLVDPDEPREIRGEALHSSCGWTPFEGRQGVFPDWTMLRGEFAYRDGDFGDARGRNVRSA